MATVVVPGFLVWWTEAIDVGWGLPGPLAVLPPLAGAALFGLGLALFVATVRLFARVGEGTLAPWDPPRRLVVRGPYRHVRHPMISGVACVLLGEALALGSPPLAIWFAAFVAVNAAYLPLVEEPRLRRRFGDDYDEYSAHVPRFVPRRDAWEPLG